MRKLEQLFDLSGSVALVTGGGRGLGEQIARGLAQAGAAVERTEAELGPVTLLVNNAGASWGAPAATTSCSGRRSFSLPRPPAT